MSLSETAQSAALANSKQENPEQVVVCALYKFVTLADYQEKQKPLLDFMLQNEIKGTLLLANEGINGTVAATRQAIDDLLTWLKQDPRLAELEHKESFDNTMPFYRSKVKLKKEIVTMGVEGIDPKEVVGTYVKAEDWNELIDDPEVLLVDTRNNYEVEIGTFEGAINPNTETFREFPNYTANNLDPNKHKKVAMFCTGGIRCEKSTAYLKEQGFEEVYHLEGGILKYLEQVPEEQSKWQGECFVFDNRVAVDHSLNKGSYDQCHACRMPITEQEKNHQNYLKGVSCHHCFDKQTPEQRKRYSEREKQVQLAKVRGESHIGSGVKTAIAHRKQLKKTARQQQQKQSIKPKT